MEGFLKYLIISLHVFCFCSSWKTICVKFWQCNCRKTAFLVMNSQLRSIFFFRNTVLRIFNGSCVGAGYDGSCFANTWQDKVVVFLNDLHINNQSEKIRSTDYPDKMELFTAVKNANIATYVIGDSFNLKEAI